MTTSDVEPETQIGVVQDLGWGRLVFGQTFVDADEFGNALRAEASGRRDIGMYLDAPHVFVALHPQEFFIDPSFTYRLTFARPGEYQPADVPGLSVRPVQSIDDCAATNQIYLQCRMVPADVDLMWSNSEHEPHMVYMVATDDETGAVVGTVTGIDHAQLFDDPENGSSLWCLAVDPTLSRPGVGGLLVRSLVAEFARRGRAQMDLSVLHDNEGAIALYERMGFERVPVLGIKRKNAINEKLFAPVQEEEGLAELNPYARIIADGSTRVKDYFGGRIRLATSGGAPLPLEVAEFFAAADLPILQAYGLTENVCVAFNRPDRFKFGTVGPPMPGCEVRIAADKEILVRSEMMFSGYYKAPEETAKVFSDGWLLTGDLGEIDEDGFLKIIGRKKELIVTSTGKKVAPALLENMLKESHLISQAMVYGEGRSYLVALVTLNAAAKRETVQAIIDGVNRRVSSTESIKRFAILERDFEIARDEITPTGKLKRDVITNRYRNVIDRLYLPALV